jgi:hypothetical protein
VSTIQRLAQSCRCTGQLTTGTAHLTRKMTCRGSGAGTVRLMKRPLASERIIDQSASPSRTRARMTVR